MLSLKNILYTSLKRLTFYAFRICPINKRKIVFLNTNSYLSGPLNAVYDELIQNGCVENQIVILSNSETLINERKTVKYGSLKSIYEIVTSKVWISDGRQQSYFKKRKKQFYIMTWHGSAPIKFIEKDAEATLPKGYIKCAKNDSKNADLLVAQSKHMYSIMRNSFWYEGAILRESFTKEFNELTSKTSGEIHREFGIPLDKKIILYVPTFRKNSNEDCYNLDYQNIVDRVSGAAGKQYVIIVRLHENALQFAKNIKYNESVLYGTDYPSVEKLISAADYVITDYSGCLFKAYYAGRNVVLYMPDLSEYLMHDRGTYYDLKKLPSPIARDETALIDAIVSYDEKRYLNGREEILSKIGYYGGNAEKTIARMIMHTLERE